MRLWKALLAAVVIGTCLVPLQGATAMAAPSDVRVLTWNIWKGGQGAGPANLPQLLDQVVAVRPDVFFAVETYGSADEIRQELTRRAGKGEYHAAQITARPDGGDNLWIFTRYPIVQVYPKPVGDQVSDFNFGGVRVRLPDSRELNLFDVWLPYIDPWNGYLIDENAASIRAGHKPPNSPQDVADAERAQTDAISDILQRQLPAMLAGNADPVVMGGDFNTPSAADWQPQWADCPTHYGMSYPLRATSLVTEAGFTDTFRAAHPDACGEDGRTWTPQPAEQMITPARIDFTFAKGNVEVRAAHVLDRRLEQHGDGVFYSDHAAVVSDLTLGRQS